MTEYAILILNYFRNIDHNEEATMHTFQSLHRACETCRTCALWETRNRLVFGTGNEMAEILFVGEGPGKNEDEQGEPFVGRGGKLLDSYLESIGLNRKQNIYLTNIVKCRPPENRDPRPEEQNACLPYLAEQFRLMQPKIVVCVGRIAAKVMIDKNFAIMKQHGQWYYKNDIWFMATLHPAALLRSPAHKPLATEDFFALRKKIGEVCRHTSLLDG